MELMDVINKRRSIRKFINKQVSDEQINLIIKAGMQAPTAANQQANCFMIIRNKENLTKLFKLLPSAQALETADSAILVLIDKGRLKRRETKSQDASNATLLMLLEATNLGLGSCWCNLYPEEERVKVTREVLNIPESFIPFSIVALGYPENANQLFFINRFDETRVLSD